MVFSFYIIYVGVLLHMTTEEYLRILRKYPSADNAYDGWESDYNFIRIFNEGLVLKYPWLEPHNRWTGNVPDTYDYSYTELDEMPDGWRLAFGDQMCEEIEKELERFDYQDKYEIVQIKEKFGGLRWYDNGTPFKTSEKPVKEFERKGFDVLKRDWDPSKYCLRDLWSDHYISPFDENVDMSLEEIDEYNKDAVHHYALYEIIDECKVPEIIDKYTELSRHTCINCGKPAEWESMGWISPYCEDCARDMSKGSPIETKFTKIDTVSK